LHLLTWYLLLSIRAGVVCSAFFVLAFAHMWKMTEGGNLAADRQSSALVPCAQQIDTSVWNWISVQEYVYNKLKFRSGFNPTGLMQMTLVHKFCCPRKLEASFRGSINLAWSFISLLCQFSSELHFMAYFNLTDLTWVCSGGGLGAQLWLVLHICAGTCILRSHLLLWVQSKAHPESLEDLLQALCCTDITWAHQGIPYVSQLPSSNHVQVHQGCSTSSP